MRKYLKLNSVFTWCFLALTGAFVPISVAVSAASGADSSAPDSRWAELAPNFFGDQEIVESSDVILSLIHI